MRPAFLTLPLLLVALALAPATGARTRAHAPVLTGLQAKVTTISARKGRMRATILTTGDARSRRLKGRTLVFDLAHARVTVADTNGDGRANTLADVRQRDLVGLQVRLPAHGALPRAIPVATLMDLTALLSTPSLPQIPAGPAAGELPTGR